MAALLASASSISLRSLRKVGSDIPRICLAIALTDMSGSSLRICLMCRLCSLEKRTSRLPRVFPSLRALASPSRVLSRISSLSNSAIAPRMVATRCPCGEDVSMGWSSSSRPTPHFSRSCMIPARFTVERASLSILVASILSTLWALASASILFRSGLLGFAPDATSMYSPKTSYPRAFATSRSLMSWLSGSCPLVETRA